MIKIDAEDAAKFEGIANTESAIEETLNLAMHRVKAEVIALRAANRTVWNGVVEKYKLSPLLGYFSDPYTQAWCWNVAGQASSLPRVSSRPVVENTAQQIANHRSFSLISHRIRHGVVYRPILERL